VNTTPGGSIIKRFTAIIYGFYKQAKVFVRVKPFHASLMVEGKARALVHPAFQVLHARISSFPFPNALEYSGKAFRRQREQFITNTHKLRS
jgi:hypothetical protein